MTHWAPHATAPASQVTTQPPPPALPSSTHQSVTPAPTTTSAQHAAAAPQSLLQSHPGPHFTTDSSPSVYPHQPQAPPQQPDQQYQPPANVPAWPRPNPPGMDATWATPPTYPPSRPVFPGFPMVGPREHYMAIDPQIHPRHRQLCEMQAQELLITIAKSEAQQYTAQLHDITNPSTFPSRPGDAYLSRLLRFRSTLWAQIATDLSTYLHTLQQQQHRDVQQFVNAPPLPLHWPPYVYEASTPQRLLYFDHLSTLRPAPLPYDLSGRDADSSVSSDPSS